MMQRDAAFEMRDVDLEVHGSRITLTRVATIAWLAIGLGFVMQGLILAAKLLSGDTFPGAQLFVDLTQGITWSVVVCLGVGIGTTIAKARPVLVGFWGLLSAPLAVALAKGSEKVMASFVEVAGQPTALSIATISGLRAVEYGILGWLLGSLAAKQAARLRPYLLSGGAVGILFGGAISILSYQVTLAKGLQPALPKVAGGAVNEVVFPIGCALVVYIGQLVGRHLDVISKRSS